MTSRLTLERLATVQVVPPTPFSADAAVVLPERLARLVAGLYHSGVRVFLPAAGTGEFHSLSASEIEQCITATRKALPADAVVIAPTGMGIGFALETARRAAECGADGLLVMPPVHPYLCDAGLRDYFQAIASATGLPLLAYKKGPFPSDELLLELCAAGTLLGIKYAVNDLDAVGRFAAKLDPGAGLYCGTAEKYAPYFMLAGARGYTSGVGNLCPRLTLAMHRALQRAEHPEALRILAILRPVEDYRARAVDSYNISMLKVAMRVAGHDFGPPRAPQRRLTATEEQEVARIVEPILAAERAL